MPVLASFDFSVPRAGFSWKPVMRPLVEDHHAVLVDLLDRQQPDRRQRAPLAVERDQRREVGVGEVVAADDDERAALAKPGLHLLEPARAPGQLGLLEVVQPHAVARAVAERRPHRVGQVEHVDRDVADAERGQPAHDVPADRLARDRHHGLGHFLGQRVEARAHAAGQDHRSHVVPLSLHQDGLFPAERDFSASPSAASAKRGRASWRRQRRGSLASR